MNYTYQDYTSEWTKQFGYAKRGQVGFYVKGQLVEEQVTMLNEIEFKIAMAQHGTIHKKLDKALSDKSVAQVKIDAMFNVIGNLETQLLLNGWDL